jgi:hypothetical protein
LHSFGITEENLVELKAREFHFTKSKKDGKEFSNVVIKKFLLVQSEDIFLISEENNTDQLLKVQGKSVKYNDFYFKVNKISEYEEQLVITTPLGEVIKETPTKSVELLINDYDNAGDIEIMSVRFSGGAHCCFSLIIYQFLNYGIISSQEIGLGDSYFEFEDINGDSKKEFVASNTVSAYQFTSFAASVFTPIIYEYSNGNFSEITYVYTAYINQHLTKIVDSMIQILAQHNNTLDCSSYNIDDYNGWMSDYRAHIAAATIDLLISEGKENAYSFFTKYYNCSNTFSLLWNKILELSKSYNLNRADINNPAY